MCTSGCYAEMRRAFVPEPSHALKNFQIKDAQCRVSARSSLKSVSSTRWTPKFRIKLGIERESMKLDTLKTLYTNELRDLYNAENQLLKALPKMAKGASSEDLKDAFEKHLEQTKSHVERLEEVFQEIGETPKGKTCKAMKGLIEEGSEILKEDGEESVIDAGIIVAAQKVEHYEIASYGSVRTFAQLLGKDRSADLLQTTLDEESEANEVLNKLAEDIVNPEALMDPELVGASSER